jgi:hypothetical protein
MTFLEALGSGRPMRRKSTMTPPEWLALGYDGANAVAGTVVNVSFEVTQEAAAALRALRDTGLFGNGVDCASIAEELLRKALLDPTILPYWRKRP